ncbi:MAG: MFS transporter, partial [Ardenticatenaceae bacterium]
RWVFYLNIPFGILAAILIALALEEPVEERDSGRVDFIGAVLLTGGVLSLLYALLQGGTAYAWSDPLILGLFALALASLLAFIWVERRIESPLIPLTLFSDRLFATASIHGFVAGLALFGVASYVPLFVQGVLGTSATRAGASLTPMVLGWVSGSVVAGYILLRAGPRLIVIVGTITMVSGALVLTALRVGSPQAMVLLSMLLMGLGMGLTITSYLVSVQNRVARRRLGVATSSLQFIRQIGGTIGVSLMGAVLAARFSAGLATLPGGTTLDPQTLLDRSAALSLPPAVESAFQRLLADALYPAFLIALIAALVGLAIAFFTPRGSTRQLVATGEREEPVAPLEQALNVER